MIKHALIWVLLAGVALTPAFYFYFVTQPGLVEHYQIIIDEEQSKRLYWQEKAERLEAQMGSVQELEAQKAALLEELDAIHEQRRAVMPAKQSFNVRCTGSMEPALTCFDIITVINNPTPEDIQVGTIIYYDPPYDCANNHVLTMHRVVAISDQGYLTRGDNTISYDGCWVPFGNVMGYVIDIDKIPHAEGDRLVVELAQIDIEQRDRLSSIVRMDIEIDRCNPCSLDEVNTMIRERNRVSVAYNDTAEVIRQKRARMQALKDNQE